ncbi:MAG TPA: PilZ domain-containing protein [Symbiobacteriaceae bacterium]
MDEATVPVDIRSLAGLAGRLLVTNRRSDQVRELKCVVRKIDRSEITLELGLAEEHHVAPRESVVLEATGDLSLVQCFTSVVSLGKEGRLVLRTPPRIHIVQRRRFPRVDVFLGITLRTPDRSVDPLPGQLINLSIDGAACVVTEPIAVGTLVTVNLTAIGLQPTETQAKVVRSAPSPDHLWVIGVQFQGLIPDQQRFLGNYISDITG